MIKTKIPASIYICVVNKYNIIYGNKNKFLPDIPLRSLYLSDDNNPSLHMLYISTMVMVFRTK